MSTVLRFALHLLSPLIAAALLLAACASAPAPTLPPSPSPTPAFTPAPALTPSPTLTPAVGVITGARVPAAPTVGGRPWAGRTWPATALAGLLAEAGAVGAVVADEQGQVHAWTADGAWWLGEGPAGWAWDAAAQVWRRGDAAFLPDVLLPGGWDAAAGRAAATAAAEMVWLWQDGEGAYRIAALYGAGAVRPADLAAAGGMAVALADGRVLYLMGAEPEPLAPGEALVRDEAGALLKVLADGSRYRRATAWGNVRSAAELHQAGAFGGPLAMGLLAGEPDRFVPPIPYAPESVVPEDWQEKGYRYAFPDPQNLKAQVLDANDKVLAQATYSQQEGRWVWEKVEEKLQLVPAELTMDEAKRFIAGAKYWSEEELKQRFEGRVFVFPSFNDGKPIRLITTSDLRQKIESEIRNKAVISSQDLRKKVGEKISENPIWEWLKRYSKYQSLNTPYIPLSEGDVVILKEDGLWIYPKQKEGVLVENNLPFFISLDGQIRKINRQEYLTIEKQIRSSFAFLWNDYDYWFGVYDGWQARYTSSDGVWRFVLPHERKNGQYELLTPEQRMRAILKEYGQQYGLVNPDGSPKPEAFKILYNSRGEPAVLLLVEGKNGAPKQYGLNPALNNPQMFEKAWNRLIEIDPEIADILTRVYGLKIIGGDLNLSGLTFDEARHHYSASYTNGIIEINEKNVKNSPLSYAMTLFLAEARAMGHDFQNLADDPMVPFWGRLLDKNSGVDKGMFLLEWLRQNRSKLTQQELEGITNDANYAIKFYKENTR